MNDPIFTVTVANWKTEQADIRSVREQVFVREQNVPLALEWDGLDPDCIHVLARDAAGAPIGTARLCHNGHIGRMAVLSPWRGHGVGSALLKRLLALARREGYAEAHLNAQTSAVGFYEYHGFQAEGEVFMDAGIPHRRMLLSLCSP